MQTVLIVDDEMNICKLIRNLIDWKALDLTCAGEAYNGTDALAFIERKQPDIVITDIMMPKIDGLALIKEVNRVTAGQMIHFIIISGHKQFDYAYEAIKYGVVDFLLKPINREELNAALSRITSMAQSHAKTKALADREDGLEKEGAPQNAIVRKQLLVNLVHCVIPSHELSIEQVNEEYRFRFLKGEFLSGIVCTDYINELDGIKSHVANQLLQQLLTAFKEICYDIAFYTRNQFIYFVLNYDGVKSNQIYQSLRDLFSDLQRVIYPYRFLRLTVGLGKPVDSIAALTESIKIAENAIKGRAVTGMNQLIDGNGFASEKEAVNVNEFEQEIEKALELLDKEMMRKICKAYFAEVLAATENMPHVAIYLLERKTFHIIMGLVNVHAPSMSLEYADNIKVKQLKNCLDRTELQNCMETMIISEFDKLIDMKQSQDSKTIKTVKRYISDNCDKMINLEDAAKQVYLSPAYLGILFKKETGMLFSQYIVQVRIDKAKEMLKNLDYSIKEIADQLGYKDIRNFSKLFKNIVGVNPTGYRKLYHLDVDESIR